MRYPRFFNNVELTLADAVADQIVTLEVQSTDAITDRVDVDANAFTMGEYTRATLYNKGQHGDAVEVVLIVGIDPGSGVLTVVRGAEGTQSRAWDAGTKLQCRVTGGSMHPLQFTHVDAHEHALSLMLAGNYKYYDETYSEWAGPHYIPHSWQIGAAPVEAARAIDEEAQNQLAAPSVEAFGTSVVVELGVPPDHVPYSTYYPGEIVKDAQGDWFARSRYMGLAYANANLGDPSWVEYRENDDGYITRMDGRLCDPDTWFFPTEIGFICERHTASSQPRVSIGTLYPDGSVYDLTDVANDVEVENINGPMQRVILVSDFRKGVQGLAFSVETAATGGTFQGRFYWKGMFINSNTANGWPAARSSPDGLEVPYAPPGGGE